MKTLGQLRVGDTFYLINYDESNHISDVQEKVVSVITYFTTCKIVEHRDAKGNLRGTIVTKDDFDNTNATSYYLQAICSDKRRCIELLRDDKKSFLDNYSRMMEQLNP